MHTQGIHTRKSTPRTCTRMCVENAKEGIILVWLSHMHVRVTRWKRLEVGKAGLGIEVGRKAYHSPTSQPTQPALLEGSQSRNAGGRKPRGKTMCPRCLRLILSSEIIPLFTNQSKTLFLGDMKGIIKSKDLKKSLNCKALQKIQKEEE